MTDIDDAIRLEVEGAAATLSPLGAEPMSWLAGGRQLLWHGDPAHWSFRAPILFPVVGSSSGGAVRVDGRPYPMPQHGFARRSRFALIARASDRATLRLTETDETLVHYPFRFALEVEAILSRSRLGFVFTVANPGERALPYALGFHPAFAWPFAGGTRAAYRVAFAEAESPDLPGVTEAALLVPGERTAPLDGRDLPLDPDMFSEALVFLNARSRSFAFTAPSGATISMEMEDFPHLAIWTRPTAPFLSLEAWTGHADWHGFMGDLADRASMRILPPGARAQHRVTLSWQDAP